MLSLFVRNLFFTIVQPGLVVVLIPFWILGFSSVTIFPHNWQWYHNIGAITFFLGLVIMLWCIASFAIKGRGTLSPADPTKRLVVVGLYRFSRNPMYVGVMLMLIGEFIFFRSISLAIYSFLVFFAFTIFIRLVEEPRLKRDFGEAYHLYCEEVRRWI